MLGLVSINGNISPIAEGRVQAHDRGLLYGDGIYEVIAAVGSSLIDLDEHLARLRRSALETYIEIPWSDEALRFELEHIVQLGAFPRSSVRLHVTRGIGLGLRAEGKLTPNRYIYCSPAKNPSPANYEQALKLKIKRHPGAPKGPQVKSPSYLPAIIALAEAQTEGFDEVLWCNNEGEITEAASANIFLISRQGDLVEIATPPSTSGILLGITRARIINLLHRSQIPVTERIITLEELPRFDEAFVTSSVRGPFPVQLIDRHRLHSTRPQAVFHHILRLYRTWESLEGKGSIESDPSLS
ncbi:MAG: aminotransferase class IV [Proteobacteria bacterium]|nr:aminotransferase class IV [Pseudomonadota bacterium]